MAAEGGVPCAPERGFGPYTAICSTPYPTGWVMTAQFSDSVRRFVLTSIPTVPHMETLLLLWREPGNDWTADDIARRLFIAPSHACEVADELCRADLFGCSGDPRHYWCRRDPPGLVQLLAEVEAAYSRHLRQITELIHSNVDRKAARFAQAFTWEKK